MRLRAFTAIEMVAVLLLASLSATLAVVSLKGLGSRSATDEVIDRLAWCDELARHSATRSQRPEAMVFDTDRGLVSTKDVSSATESAAEHLLYHLPEHYAIRQLGLCGGDSAAGLVTIPISPLGLCQTYAMQLSDGHSEKWLMVSGLTGQWVRVENEQQVFETLGELRARGMTLVEVVAGLALLATVLSSLLVVRARVTRQTRVMENRRDATMAADALLTDWWQNPRQFPRDANGEVPGHADLIWRTQTLFSGPAARLGGQVERLEIYKAPPQANDAPLAAVEVLLPVDKNR